LAPFSLALLLAVAAPAPAPVEAALRRALALPGARVAVEGWRPALPDGCALAEAEAAQPISASGAVAVRLRGRSGERPCEAWGWAAVRVFQRGAVAARSHRAGEPLEAVAGEVEVRPGRAPLADLPEGAVAARAIPAGAPVEESAVRHGPLPGAPVAVLLRSGLIAVETSGKAVPCPRGRACALLSSGRRVEGRLEGGRILVEPP